MARKLDFGNAKSTKLASKGIQRVDEDMDNKKRDIELSKIHMNPDNENVFGLDDIDYLAENIKEDGFAGAIEVYALDDGTYEISSGHRRFLAAQEIGMEKIPCIVSENVDDKTKSKRLVKSNILNRKMTPLKWAKTLDYYKVKVLYDFPGRKNEELARVFKMSEATVKRLQYLLKLVPELQEFADYENVSYTNLIAVANLEPDEQRQVYKELKKQYPNEPNVFTAVSKITLDQWIIKIKELNGKPTKDQLDNRIKDEEEQETVIPQIPNYEDSVSKDMEETVAEMDKKVEKAKIIDNQLSIYATNIHDLVKTSYEISEETRKKVIDELTQVLQKLKKKH